MSSQPSFTGRARQRRTSRLVRAGDRVAKFAIIVGGIGTIVAVLLVCVFLVWIAAPLFSAPAVNSALAVRRVDGDRSIRRIVADNDQAMAWIMYADGTLEVVQLTPQGIGRVLQRRSPSELFGDATLTAAMFSTSGDHAAFGFGNGAVRLADIQFVSRIIDPSEISTQSRGLGIGESTPHENGLLFRTAAGQLRHESVSFELAKPIDATSQSAVRHLDQMLLPNGNVLVWLSDDGAIEVVAGRSRKNLLTGETTVKYTTSTLPPPATQNEPPSHVFVAAAGNGVYAIWPNGQLLRYNISDLDAPRLVEQVDLLPDPDARITATTFMPGKATLVVGDSTGVVRGWFLARDQYAEAVDGARLVAGHTLQASQDAITALAASRMSRLLAVGDAAGNVRLYFLTSDKLLLSAQAAGSQSIAELAIGPKDDAILAATSEMLNHWRIDAKYPEVSLSSLTRPIWYEGYAEPEYLWQSSSGSDAGEPKMGLWPLVFGTLKATFYSLLFGVPIALLAAVYTSEFLQPQLRSRIKPTIELMAGLPSVVLGFLAALVFAPVIERILPSMLASFYTTPVTLMLAAFFWQLAPHGMRLRLGPWRLAMLALVLPVGILMGFWLGPIFEDWLFAGDIRAWLDGRVGAAAGGWMLLLVPVCAIMTVLAITAWVNPWLRRHGRDWERGAAAWVELAKFVGGLAATLLLATALSWMLQGLGFDLRGHFFGAYDQRNSLIVGIVMGFAIIPIVYTIAEDALSSVPRHLRSASLGAGATPWQTATRIVIPTAMSGLFSAVMIGLGRAVGETMIVLMATGNTPVLDLNPFNGSRTLSANLAVELPEAVRNSAHYRMLFFAALVLFTMTFVLNTFAELVRQRFRKRAYQL